ncbi:acylneuraminate cytidylyltransferase family protein [Porticoccaceae bacterium]|nr:acylneuraminate cytidylyltransferase family protein [Porticoccaceae bacterium]
MTKNIAVIPARGGSKGVPKKNLKLLKGKPLIVWTIESAISAKCLDRVIVSTDCKEIAAVAKKAGADVPFLRPSNLSGDTATTESAVLHCIDWLKVNENYVPDNIFLLQATSPIRKTDTIDRAYSKFIEAKVDSLLGVNEFWHFLWQDGIKPKALYDYRNRPRRQDIDKKSIKYRENGSIYITKNSIFMIEKNRISGDICMFIMDEIEGYEIDTLTDFSVVEGILNSLERDKP